MRRITTIATTLMLMVALSAGAAFAALVEGNSGNNTLTGTPRADVIHAYGGNDLVSALEGRDEVHGGYGDDHLISQDLNSGGIGQRDVVDCGPGYDTFEADYEDRVLDNCEEGSVGGF